jgi:hypothetical protein
MVYEFNTQKTRRVTAEDRLHCRLGVAFSDVPGSDASTQGRVKEFCSQLCDFYRNGGSRIGGDPLDDVLLESPRLWLQTEYRALEELPEIKLIKIYGDIFYDFEWRESDSDTVLYVLRHFTKTLSAARHFSEMLSINGPPNGVKSAVVMSLLTLMGVSKPRTGYVRVAPNNFLSSLPRSDAQSAKPVTNQFAGSRCDYIKEAANQPVCGDALKDILHPRDAPTAAPQNFSKQKDKGSVKVTWSILSCGQHPLRLNEGESDTGIIDKVAD